MKRAQKIKIGFDLDGVLLYNPARIFRPITVSLKKILKRKKRQKTHFYYPKTKIEQFIWLLVHYSSLFIAPGFEDIRTLSKNPNIELYIVTSRYDCLKGDFDRWLKKMHASEVFHGTFHNAHNLQPHVFKAQQIAALKLDYFVEDNWDIVRHITSHTKTKALWISNTLDRDIPYPHKFLSLKAAVHHLKQLVSQP